MSGNRFEYQKHLEQKKMSCNKGSAETLLSPASFPALTNVFISSNEISYSHSGWDLWVAMGVFDAVPKTLNFYVEMRCYKVCAC